MDLHVIAALACLLGFVCCNPPTHVVLSVEDPRGLAAAATKIAVGTDLDRLDEISLSKSLPITILLTVDTLGQWRDVWVEARDASSGVLARGFRRIGFDEPRGGTAAVVLDVACDAGMPDGVDCPLRYDSGERGICVAALCAVSVCGDGYIDATTGEACDDGNSDNEDGCLESCVPNECGDGFLHRTVEECDDGNDFNGDDCLASCISSSCGDAFVHSLQEACDDGNANPNDGCNQCAVVRWLPSLLTGLGPGGGKPLETPLFGPTGVLFDSLGNLFVTDARNHRVLRIDTMNRVMPLAGTGAAGFSGDGRHATIGGLDTPWGLALDGFGNLIIADYFNHRVRRVDTNGIITTLAGTGVDGSDGDDGYAAGASLSSPVYVTHDWQGNLYISDVMENRVRRVDAGTGIITTFAGDGSNADPPIIPTDATVSAVPGPAGLVFDADGALYIASIGSDQILRVDQSGILSIVAGSGTWDGLTPLGSACTDNTDALAMELRRPATLALDRNGDLYVGEEQNYCIRRLDLAAAPVTVTAIAGTGTIGAACEGCLATTTQLGMPYGLAVAEDGALIVADFSNDRVHRIDTAGVITTLVGSGANVRNGDNGPARQARLVGPAFLELDQAGHLFISDYDDDRIRQLDIATGIITTLAGADGTIVSTGGDQGDGGDAAKAMLDGPVGMAFDPVRNRLYFADSINQSIRWVALNDSPPTIDIVPLPPGALLKPAGIVLDSNGVDLYIADMGAGIGAGKVKVVDLTSPTAAVPVADGASGLLLTEPLGVALDGAGNLFVADTSTNEIWKVELATSTVSLAASAGGTGILDSPNDIRFDGAGDLLIADHGGGRIQRLNLATGLVDTLVGSNTLWNAGEGIGRLSVTLVEPLGMAVDAQGNLYFTEYGASRVRHVQIAADVVTTIAGGIDLREDAPFATAKLGDAAAIIAFGSDFLIADGSSGRIRKLDMRSAAAGGQRIETVVGIDSGNEDGQDPLNRASLSRLLGDVRGIAFDSLDGWLFVAERQYHVIRRIQVPDIADPSGWTIEPYTGVLGVPGNPVPGAETIDTALYRNPTGLLFDPSARLLYVADTGNNVIRQIDVDSASVTTVVGTSTAPGIWPPPETTDVVAASAAVLRSPRALALAFDGAGLSTSLYIADTGNHRVRRLDLASMMVNTVIGNGLAGSGGTGSPASAFAVDSPNGLAVDRYGNLYVTSRDVVRAVYAGADGVADRDDFAAIIYGAAPQDIFPEPVTDCLTGIAVDPMVSPAARLYLLDSCMGFVVQLDR